MQGVCVSERGKFDMSCNAGCPNRFPNKFPKIDVKRLDYIIDANAETSVFKAFTLILPQMDALFLFT